ncbi:MAG: hypothetical protein HW392_317 [Steroidobacteraceae bacterium]|nr:hypothetical protein [Steroidobacteraceae bacterium]
MLKSMTGFARCERTTAAGVLAWELRGVNHRYLEVGLRVPEELRSAEAEFRQAIAASVRRGKVDATLYLRPAIAGPREFELDDKLLDRLVESALLVQRRLGAAGTIDAVDLLRWPGVVREPLRDTTTLAATAQGLLAEALMGFQASRANEGERIAEMLTTRARAVQRITKQVVARLPDVHARIRARLQERLAALTGEGNPERLEQEIAMRRGTGPAAKPRGRNDQCSRRRRGSRPQARFPDAGVQPRGEHAVVEVPGRRDDAVSG